MAFSRCALEAREAFDESKAVADHGEPVVEGLVPWSCVDPISVPLLPRPGRRLLVRR